ncbi:MAG: copper-binding protein [Chloroflexi bacterium]|nr:copper-binding protein [Chloroflexota bacterium]
MDRRLLAAMTACALLVAACAAAAPEVDITKGQIGVDLKEHTISLTSREVRSGTVTFVSRNRGSIAHDLIVLRTDLTPDKVPLDTNTQKAKEDGRVGGVEEIAPGKNANLRLELAPGHYVLICNVPTHFQLGMRTELTVN